MNNTPQTGNKKLGWIPRVLLIAIILATSAAIAVYMLSNKPRAERKPRTIHPPLVQTMKLHKTDHKITVHAMGTVVPSQSVDLASRVAGEIIAISPPFLPGGRFKAGEEILRIDPTDYELAVQQRQSDVAKAEYELKLELGKQSVARREYQLLGETIQENEQELVLREPQLKASTAARAAAEASLQKARLDLKRTYIMSPFNAVVLEKHVGLGSRVTVGTKLVTLLDTDQYWVEVVIPMDRVSWITSPGIKEQVPSSARITHSAAWGKDKFRTGTVKSLLPGVDEESRMARVLISVDDPLCLKEETGNKPQLTLGTFVRVEIEGRTISDVTPIPRSALHDGSRVWIMAENDTLDIREVEVIWHEDETVFVKNNLHDGERLIISSLATPVADMRLREAAGSLSQPKSKGSSSEVEGL